MNILYYIFIGGSKSVLYVACSCLQLFLQPHLTVSVDFSVVFTVLWLGLCVTGCFMVLSSQEQMDH